MGKFDRNQYYLVESGPLLRARERSTSLVWPEMRLLARGVTEPAAAMSVVSDMGTIYVLRTVYQNVKSYYYAPPPRRRRRL